MVPCSTLGFREFMTSLDLLTALGSETEVYIRAHAEDLHFLAFVRAETALLRLDLDLSSTPNTLTLPLLPLIIATAPLTLKTEARTFIATIILILILTTTLTEIVLLLVSRSLLPKDLL